MLISMIVSVGYTYVQITSSYSPTNLDSLLVETECKQHLINRVVSVSLFPADSSMNSFNRFLIKTLVDRFTLSKRNSRHNDRNLI
jgi:archaellum component FlaF (FlaF/FlaG flagellin family)